MGRQKPAAVAFAICAVFMLQTSAFAQPQPSTPRVSASVTAGLASPMHGDLDFTTPEWQVAVRGAVDKRVVIEVFFDQWRESEETVAPAGSFRGPGGVAASYDRLRYGTQFTVRTVGFNALFKTTFERVTITGGGGPGFWTFQRASWFEYDNCRSNQPEICVNGERSRHANGSFSVQAVAGVDIALTTRTPAVGIVTQFQFIVPVRDPGSGHTSLLAGLRVGLR